LSAAVDSHGLFRANGGNRHDLVSAGDHHGQGIRQIKFLLDVIRLDLLQRRKQDAIVEEVITRVHLSDRPLGRVAVAVLNDTLEVPVGIPNDTSVTGRILQHRRGQGRRRLFGLVLLDQRLECLGLNQGTVPAEDQRLAREIL